MKKIIISESIFNEANIKELSDGFYLKLDTRDNNMLSVYVKQNINFTPEQIFSLMWKVLNIFINPKAISSSYPENYKIRITKKSFLLGLDKLNLDENEYNLILKLLMPLIKDGLILRAYIKKVMLNFRDNLPKEQVGEAHFYYVKGKDIIKDNKVKVNFEIDPNKEYLQGAMHVESVFVEPEYRGQNFAVQMYKFAEEQTGLKIIPSGVLSAGGKQLHKKLGNIYEINNQ